MQKTQETWVQSLGQEDPLEEGMTTHSSILAWEIPWQRSLADWNPWVAESDTAQWLSVHDPEYLHDNWPSGLIIFYLAIFNKIKLGIIFII